jgi:hypothetical protein
MLSQSILMIAPVSLSLYTIKNRTAPSVWWFMMLLMLTPMGQHAVGAVLCIEANGSVTIEKAIGFLCGSSEVSANKHETDTVGSTDTKPSSHCNSCIDVVLPGESDEDCASFLLARGPTAQVNLPVVAVLTPPVRLSDPETLSARRTLADTLDSSFSLTPLRSVILLL